MVQGEEVLSPSCLRNDILTCNSLVRVLQFDDDKVSVVPKEKITTLDGGGEGKRCVCPSRQVVFPF